MERFTIRTAASDDAEALLDIYSWYVERTAITFELEVPDLAEFRERICNTLTKYPYLVAERDGRILGYAYAGAFHPRAAYSRCAEVSIYLRADERRRGLGRALYAALEEALRKMGILNLYACISDPIKEDEYLSFDSERFHSRMGYEKLGTFHSCGYKFGRWYNMVWMEKLIGPHGADQPDIQPFPGV